MHSSAEVQTETEPADAGRFIRKPILGWKGWSCFVAVSVFLQIVTTSVLINNYDEGAILYGTVRAMHGQAPYSGFWTLYAPGQFYLLGAIFQVFGTYAFWDRALYIAGDTATLVACLWILLALTRRLRLSLCAAGVLLLWLTGIQAYGSPLETAIALICVATALMFRHWREGRPRLVLVAGVLLGLSVVFRQDVGVYAAVAVSLGCILFQGLAAAKDGERVAAAAREIAKLWVGLLIVVVPVAVLMFVFIPAHDMNYALLWYPVHVYAKVRGLPFPTFRQVGHGLKHPLVFHRFPSPGDSEFNVIWVPILAFVSACVWLIPAWRSRAYERWRMAALWTLTLLVGLLYLKGLVRVAPVHVTQSLVFAMVLFGCALAAWRTVNRAAKIAFVVSLCLLFVCSITELRIVAGIVHDNLTRLRSSAGERSFAAMCHPAAGLERMRCLALDEDNRKAALYLQQHSLPTGRIFVGDDRHDILFASDIILYFASKRETATRWYQLDPGVETTAPIQREMMEDLNRNRAVFVMRAKGYSQSMEPNDSRYSSGVTLLDDYINSNYSPDQSFGDIDVLRRTTPFEQR